MNPNLALSKSDSLSAEFILLRSIQEALPELWIVDDEEIDIRDATMHEDYLLDWHHSGRNSVRGVVPELSVTETIKVHQELASQMPRRDMTTLGMFGSARND